MQRLTFWADSKQINRLKRLSRESKIQQAVFLRDALDRLLDQYEKAGKNIQLKISERSSKGGK